MEPPLSPEPLLAVDDMDINSNPSCGQLNKENIYFLSPLAPENLVSRDGFGRPSPCQPLILRTKAESSIWCLLTSSIHGPRFPRPRQSLPSTAIGSVPSLSGHAITYRSRLPPRVRRHKAGSPQGSSSKECCICRNPTDHFLCAPLFRHPVQYYSYSSSTKTKQKYAMLRLYRKR